MYLLKLINVFFTQQPIYCTLFFLLMYFLFFLLVSPLEVFIVVENYVGFKTCIHFAFEYVSTTFLHPNYHKH
jgi:hypothetical protein